MTDFAARQIATLQAHVDRLGSSAEAALGVVLDEKAPAAARRVLVGALNYWLDPLDAFPDHYGGLGAADDAIVLWLAAQKAREAGASGLDETAASDPGLDVIIDLQRSGLEALVGTLPEHAVHGRNAAGVLGDRDTRALFEGDVRRTIAGYQAGPIRADGMGPQRLIDELCKMLEHAARKAEMERRGI